VSVAASCSIGGDDGALVAKQPKYQLGVVEICDVRLGNCASSGTGGEQFWVQSRSGRALLANANRAKDIIVYYGSTASDLSAVPILQ